MFSKVFIHSPDNINLQSTQLEGNVRLLNINQVVTSLACGQLDEQLKRDLLIVGTSTNIIAHDVDRNVDLFFKEVGHNNQFFLLIFIFIRFLKVLMP